jgi:hypothetical protein
VHGVLLVTDFMMFVPGRVRLHELTEFALDCPRHATTSQGTLEVACCSDISTSRVAALSSAAQVEYRKHGPALHFTVRSIADHPHTLTHHIRQEVSPDSGARLSSLHCLCHLDQMRHAVVKYIQSSFVWRAADWGGQLLLRMRGRHA